MEIWLGSLLLIIGTACRLWSYGFCGEALSSRTFYYGTGERTAFENEKVNVIPSGYTGGLGG